MDVCDKVTAEESGAKDAVLSLIKRLAHRNANVQLYTLELANSLSQNCSIKLHRELASRAFTDALLRLATDRNTNQQVKTKIVERMQEWVEMFKDPDLGIMRDQYEMLKSQNPHLQPPSAPSKSRLTDIDRQKEEEELQMALRLSIQQEKPVDAKKAMPMESSSQSAQVKNELETTIPVPSGTTAATVSRVRALYDFQASDPDELTFSKGDIIAVLESVYKDWWKGLLKGRTGIFPLNYVEKLADPTPEELRREAQVEAEVFAEIKNVEKLLTLLSTASPDMNIEDNDEIGKLYYSTLAMRPKLIELIGKYSQKKDEFTQLNERFIKSCRDYENLLDASVSQNQSSYHQYGHSQGREYVTHGALSQQEIIRNHPPTSLQDQQYPQQSSSTQNYMPPRNGPAPFYIVPQLQQTSIDPQGTSYPNHNRDSLPLTPLGSVAKPAKPAHLQSSMIAPNQNSPSQPQVNYNISSQQISHELPAQLAQTVQPAQPSPPTVCPPPPSLTAGYPIISQSSEALDTRKPLPVHGPYTAYQRPDTPQDFTPSAPPGDPADFYRSSAT
ncbi:Class E vacuolar protein-sorting machinery protein hse1 [Erysiphe neolycopersici]|uniref:Class E vacuolar protein-sorting machinery protein HSE1 n=1 Tax=Erysiphe neolycopersici TaxID=212602 RepID=A0A420HZ94_9PEZI|nr:Class E vacuolar protein-sorting machinery protein hse1 [Erysiphe neolycopersici]